LKSKWQRLPEALIKLVLLGYDIAVVQAASIAALMVRFDFRYNNIPKIYINNLLVCAVVNTIITVSIFRIFRFYNSIWSFVGSTEIIKIFEASVLSGLESLAAHAILGMVMPRSYYVLYPGFLFAATAVIRLFYRMARYIRRRERRFGAVKKIALVGAGEAGSLILNEISDGRRYNGEVVCVIDDNPHKKNKYICGVKILGGRELIPQAVREYGADEIVVATPSAPPKELSEILKICNDTGKRVKILPGVYQLLNGEASVSKLRDVELADWLGREPVKVNLSEILFYASGKTILVTGGGGSIGSELCRQLAKCAPKLLIILDVYENNAYDLQQELKRNFPTLNLLILIASVRDSKRMNNIFATYRPDIVYHAAAHKHVPLMETSPGEAVKNNAFGALNVARAAGKFNAQRFVLISTDKAVNPTNIMGASKRMCEMIIQAMNNRYNTEYVAVRFGNVLGSAGSVIPLFRKQIETGGPVTVTHKDIIRYFMTIPEAVSLVLQAGAYAKGGEIFVLDMGEPIKIADLARNIIKLSGYEPDVDMKIEYVGLRPGEKLFEETLMAEEGLKMTENKLIRIAKPISFDEKLFFQKLASLREDLDSDGERVKAKVSEIVGTYKYIPESMENIERKVKAYELSSASELNANAAAIPLSG
jgi:FlaA1/EpsC-like NDP-sugar epimerase